MAQSSSRRSLAVVAAASFSLSLATAVVAPTLAGASTHNRRTQPLGALVKVATVNKYGKILVDASGKTLYFNTAETVKSLKCTGNCLKIWPPLLTKGKPRAGTGVVAKELSDVKRGSAVQVTYHGLLLYTFSGDRAAGQANGEGIAALGGTWYVLSSTGAPVKPSSSSTTSGGYGGGGGY